MCQVNEKVKNSTPHCSHVLTDFSETQNQKRYKGNDPARKIWLMWDDGKRVCENSKCWLTFGSFFFCTLRVASRSHRRTDTNKGSKCVFLRKKMPFGGLDNKK